MAIIDNCHHCAVGVTFVIEVAKNTFSERKLPMIRINLSIK